MTTSLRAAAASVTALLCGALLVPGTSTGASVPTHGSSGVGDPYWPLDGNGGIDVASYAVHNTYELATGRLRGRTRVRLTATQDLTSFSLDFLLPVSSVSVDSRRATFERRAGGHELRVTPERALSAGSRHTVVVRYAGRPGTRTYAGQSNWLADRHEVVAMNEPHMAPWWFPANDHPSDKARFKATIRVPRGKQAISNGRLLGRSSSGRWTTWRWKADEPMTSYLAFFAAGDFRMEKGRRDGLPWVVAVSERIPPAARRGAMRLMRRTPRVVAELEKDLGDYPFSITGGLTTSLPVGFALENQTRPTYPVVGSGYVLLVVHELAHQWFGNDVAVQRWRDIWLNEGLATFMEWRWTERRGGVTAADRLRSAWAGTGASSSFWDVPIGDPGPRRLFAWPVYERGAMTAQALRNRIGEEAFWSLLRQWLETKAGGNGTSEEFEALAEQVSGQDLDAFFTAWLRTPARPARTAENGLS